MGTNVAPSSSPILQFLNNAGQLNVGGSLLTQVGGVNYPTYQDAAGTTPLPNPIPLNSRGEISNSSGVSVPLYLIPSVAYTFTLYDANGNILWVDPNVVAQGATAVGQMTDELGSDGTPGFKAGTDFTAGTTTSLTLSGFYGSTSNLWVAFDAGEQGANTYQLSGHTLTFGSYSGSTFVPGPIPLGTNAVFVKGGTTASIGTPANGTVTDASIAPSGISSSKIMYLASGTGAVSRTVQSRLGDFVSVMDYGAKGDGTTDDTTAIQAAIDANKGGTIWFPGGKTFYCAGIILNGSTYDNTTLIGEGWLLMKPDGGASNFGGGWVGILLEQCDSVTIDLKINGNRLNMTAREQIFCVGLAGATRTRIPHLRTDEIRGDGLYIGQANWTASSANTSGVEVGLVEGYNSADDGRNLVSIISGQGIHIKRLVSNQIGGVINGVTEPGGLDIEPDFGYQGCFDIRVDSLDVITAGTSGLAVLGKSVSGNDANLDWNTSNIVIVDARILRTGTSGSGLAGSGFARCADLKIVKGVYQFNTTPGAGPVHDYSQRIEADWTVTNVTYGTWLAPSGTIYDFDFKITATNYTQCAVQATSLSAGRIRGRGFSSVAGTTYGIHTTNNGRSVTQGNVAYEVDLPYDNVMTYAFYNDASSPVTFGGGCIARNCDWSGYASYSATTNALIPLQDVIGMTWAAAQPANGTWNWQTFVRNTQPATAANKTTIGWARLNSGSNNATGTDWVACVVTNS